MALEFLPLIMSGLGLASQLSAAKAIPKVTQPTASETGSLQALSNQNRLIQALTNVNDPIYKNILSGEEGNLRNQTQLDLRDLLSADKRARLLGRQSYFNPERKDESIMSFLTKQGATNATTARTNALQRILGAINGYSNMGSGYRMTIPYQQERQTQSALSGPTQLAAYSDILKQFSPGQSAWTNPDTGQVAIRGQSPGQFSNIYSALGSLF